jgi:hypothetical protein
MVMTRLMMEEMGKESNEMNWTMNHKEQLYQVREQKVLAGTLGILFGSLQEETCCLSCCLESDLNR